MERLLIKVIIVFTFTNYSLFAYDTETIRIKMSDGTELKTLIMKPADISKLPASVLLARTPYGSGDAFNGMESFLVDFAGLVLVSQDLRGKHGSGDTFRLYMDDGWGKNRDGYETIEWIAAQPWCNGRIGMFGASALGITQYLASAANPPHLTCGIPIVGSLDLYRYAAYPGGVYRLYDIDGWISGVSPVMLELARENYMYNNYWQNVNCRTRLDSMNTPFLHIGGWFDIFSPAQLDAYYDLNYYGGNGAKSKQKLIIGPWTHSTLLSNKTGEIIFPENAAMDATTTVLSWINHWLISGKTSTCADFPNVQLYLMGPVDTAGYWNNWLEFSGWPFANTDTLGLFPGKDGKLHENLPENANQVFQSNPANPIPTIGGNNMSFKAGPCDQSPNWTRNDLLVFESTVYKESYDIFGSPVIKLYFSSDKTDTDIHVKLVDIYPDGRKMLISEGQARARFLKGYDSGILLEPGEEYETEIRFNTTAYTIAAGHKLGLMISSSNYPKHAVNPQNGDYFQIGENFETANNTFYFGLENPSKINLPIRKTGFKVNIDEKNISEPGWILFSFDDEIRLPDLSLLNSANYFVYSMNGELISKGNVENKNSILLNGLGNGVYFLMLTDGIKYTRYRIMRIAE